MAGASPAIAVERLGCGHQLFFLALELPGHLLQLLAVEFVAGAGKAGAFLFLDMVVHELLQNRQLRRPLLARLVAGARHLLQLLLDDLMLVDALEDKAPRLLVVRLLHLLIQNLLLGLRMGGQHAHDFLEDLIAFGACLSFEALLDQTADFFVVLVQVLQDSFSHTQPFLQHGISILGVPARMPAPLTTPAPWPVFSICRILQGANFRAANFQAANSEAANLQGAIVSHARTAGLRTARAGARAISAPGRSTAAHASRAYAPRPRRWPC